MSDIVERLRGKTISSRLQKEAATAIEASDAEIARLRVFERAVEAIIEGSIAYLPPDGIGAQDFITIVLGATDNAEIFAARQGAAPDSLRDALLERIAATIGPQGLRPCACDSCYCGNHQDAENVAAWDEAKRNADNVLGMRSTAAHAALKVTP